MGRSIWIGSALLLCAMLGCEGEDVQRLVTTLQAGVRPDEMPVMVNRELPFRYPSPLYDQKVQGNVTLRIFIDESGRVHPESTVVEEPSGYTSFDSAAVRGAEELRFLPAKLRGEPIALSVLFPVFFRHPEAQPLPGDTILGLPRPVP